MVAPGKNCLILLAASVRLQCAMLTLSVKHRAEVGANSLRLPRSVDSEMQ